MKKFKVPIILTCISATLIYLIWFKGIISIGKVINTFFSCKQDFTTSYPCYAKYDFVFVLICLGVFILSMGVIAFRLYKAIKAPK